MKTLTIKQRLFGLTALSVTVTLAISALAWANSRTAREATEALATTTQAVRESMNADMMHDAIRADVLAAQLAVQGNDAAALEAAAKDLDEHAATMKQSYVEVEKADLNDKTMVAVKAAAPALLVPVAPV